MVKTAFPLQGTQVLSVLGELRSCMPKGMAKNFFLNMNKLSSRIDSRSENTSLVFSDLESANH